MLSDCTSLFDRLRSLPVINRVAQELISGFNDEQVSVGTIADRIGSDPVLSAGLLRMANSARYKKSRSVATVSDAINLLGFVNVRTLVISIALTNCVENPPGLDIRQFWRGSLRTAVLARHLAGLLGLNADLAYLCGLMQSIGALVMRTAMPEVMLQIDESVPPTDLNRAAFEREALGYSYIEVSAELARRWDFPPVFSETIACSANPEADTLGAVVYIADWGVRADESACWPSDLAGSLTLAEVVQTDWEELCAGMEELIS